ncbi:hypothetical protein MESS2_1320016 [Mesorhizobium metallidurans STM 2683]|uniref:Uncharacterized protein n=1 Tax=Mesorhizobium metallidurans STM 2683 TaxID=1297569 RepID=M5EIQ0_9HYPH|nr:hypothetical protein MESS2_1320016 [Mesorhizobium metallidurans STM 2683]
MGAGFEAALPGDIEDALREIEMVGARSSGGGLHGNSRERTSPIRFGRSPLRTQSARFLRRPLNYGLTYFFLQ